jgi:hypothetical protein
VTAPEAFRARRSEAGHKKLLRLFGVLLLVAVAAGLFVLLRACLGGGS